MADKSRDTPLAEVTLRKYEKPYSLPERELVRKVLLSLGLLQYGDSRDIIVDIFLVLLKHSPMQIIDVEDTVRKVRKEAGLPMVGVAGSNIRRQVRRLKEAYLVEKFDGAYRVAENAPLVEVFEEKVEAYILNSIVSRIKEYLVEVEKLRPPKPEVVVRPADEVQPHVKRVILK